MGCGHGVAVVEGRPWVLNHGMGRVQGGRRAGRFELDDARFTCRYATHRLFAHLVRGLKPTATIMHRYAMPVHGI